MKDKKDLDDGDTIIEFQGVNKWFGNFHVLKDIDLKQFKIDSIFSVDWKSLFFVVNST